MRKTCRAFYLTIFSILTLAASPVFALGTDQAEVKAITGSALYKRAASADWAELDIGAVLTEGDVVKTPQNSEVVMHLKGIRKTAEIIVRQNSEFTFHRFQHDPVSGVDETLLDLPLGSILVKAEKLAGSSKFEVKTPTSIVGIRGTTFEVKAS